MLATKFFQLPFYLKENGMNGIAISPFQIYM